MITLLRHLIGWIIIILRSRQDLILENLALRQQLLVLHSKRPLSSTPDHSQAVLDWPPKAMVALERVAHSRYAKNSGDLASSRLPPLLEVALASPPRWGQKTCERGSSHAYLPNGGGESDMGNTEDSR
jgi:hypothetical protein